MFALNHVFYPKRSTRNNTPMVGQSLTVSSAAVSPVGFIADVAGNSPVQFVSFSVDGGDVRVRWDGIAPTAAIGMWLANGSNHTWDVDRYNGAQFIRAAAVDAQVFAQPLTS